MITPSPPSHTHTHTYTHNHTPSHPIPPHPTPPHHRRRELASQIESIETADIPTKLGGLLKTKGAVGLSLKIADTSFLFINSHLAAHQGAVAERNRDFKTICNGLPLPHQDHLEQAFQLISTSVRRNRNVTEMFDRVFWMGDLNYRIEVTRDEADKRIAAGDYISLLKYDAGCDDLNNALGWGVGPRRRSLLCADRCTWVLPPPPQTFPRAEN